MDVGTVLAFPLGSVTDHWIPQDTRRPLDLWPFFCCCCVQNISFGLLSLMFCNNHEYFGSLRRFWQLPTHRLVPQLQPYPHPAGFKCLFEMSFSPDRGNGGRTNSASWWCLRNVWRACEEEVEPLKGAGSQSHDWSSFSPSVTVVNLHGRFHLLSVSDYQSQAGRTKKSWKMSSKKPPWRRNPGP